MKARRRHLGSTTEFSNRQTGVFSAAFEILSCQNFFDHGVRIIAKSRRDKRNCVDAFSRLCDVPIHPVSTSIGIG